MKKYFGKIKSATVGAAAGLAALVSGCEIKNVGETFHPLLNPVVGYTPFTTRIDLGHFGVKPFDVDWLDAAAGPLIHVPLAGVNIDWLEALGLRTEVPAAGTPAPANVDNEFPVFRLTSAAKEGDVDFASPSDVLTGKEIADIELEDNRIAYSTVAVFNYYAFKGEPQKFERDSTLLADLVSGRTDIVDGKYKVAQKIRVSARDGQNVNEGRRILAVGYTDGTNAGWYVREFNVVDIGSQAEQNGDGHQNGVTPPSPRPTAELIGKTYALLVNPQGEQVNEISRNMVDLEARLYVPTELVNRLGENSFTAANISEVYTSTEDCYGIIHVGQSTRLPNFMNNGEPTAVYSTPFAVGVKTGEPTCNQDEVISSSYALTAEGNSYTFNASAPAPAMQHH